MAREIVYTDDLSGDHGAEPVKFGWDEIWWEVDLGEKNREKLLEALKPFLEVAHPATKAVGDAEIPRQRATRGTGATKRTIPVEEYGFPRRGRTSAEEQEYVKANLADVNKRLIAAGVRVIDPKDEKMKERYGL